VIHLASGKEGKFFYYLSLLIGMALLGAYMWILVGAAMAPQYLFFKLILFMSGILLVASAFGFIAADTRSSRVALTIVSGVFGGIHAYLIFTLFEYLTNVILFALMALGLMIAFAAFNWIYE
jgi:hypothetical protein